MNNKALSNIVATVLIVLLALAAVAIIWSFIKPTLEDAGEEIETQNACLQTQVEIMSCTYTTADPKTATVTARHVSGDIASITAVLSNAEGLATTETMPIFSLGSLTFSIPIGEFVPVTATIAAVIDGNTCNTITPIDCTVA